MLPDLLFANARIRHRRHLPTPHAFDYEMGYLFVNVDRFAAACAPSPFWSCNRFNLISLHDADLLHPADADIATGSSPVRQALGAALQEQLGFTLEPDHPVHVLTLPRYLGFAFNPVSFYWVHHADGGGLACIAAHITNTPWNERHLYCFACTPETVHASGQGSPTHRFRFDKRFHVSPFMPMGLGYDWRFRLSDGDGPSVIHMVLNENGRTVFDATMRFRLEPLSRWRQHLFPLLYPLQSVKIVAAIYWQALRLWLKRTPFHTHPDKHPDKLPSAGSRP